MKFVDLMAFFGLNETEAAKKYQTIVDTVKLYNFDIYHDNLFIILYIYSLHWCTLG